MILPEVVYKADPRDNVGTALAPLIEGAEYPVYEEGRGIVDRIRPVVPVPKWHKVALRDIGEGEEVVKFGYTVGISAIAIERGCIVHVTNVLLDPGFDFREVVRAGLVLGFATARLERGDVLRVGLNVQPTHPRFRGLAPRTRVGIAATAIPEGGVVRIGNLLEPPPGVRVSERYVRLVRDFYRFLRAGLIEFSRVQV